MTYALTKTKSGETNSTKRFSCFQECNKREFLIMLNRSRESLQEEHIESFQSDIDTKTCVSVMTVDNPFWITPFVYVETKIKLFTDNDTRVAEEPEQEVSRFREKLGRASIVLPISGEDQDLLDWDAHIETPPPPRSSGAIKARFRYVGQRKPIPLDDPYL
jgi:hypothetical protein